MPQSVAELSRIVTLHPRTYNEARVVGENFRDGTPVIMNLTEMDYNDAKRLVDFAAGLVFATRGTIERITAKVFLLSPPNVTVAAEDKQRIAETGAFFNQSEFVCSRPAFGVARPPCASSLPPVWDGGLAGAMADRRSRAPCGRLGPWPGRLPRSALSLVELVGPRQGRGGGGGECESEEIACELNETA